MNKNVTTTANTLKREIVWRDIIVCLLMCMLFYLPELLWSLEHAWAQNKPYTFNLTKGLFPLICIIPFVANYFWIINATLLNRKRTLMFIFWNLVLFGAITIAFHVVHLFNMPSPLIPDATPHHKPPHIPDFDFPQQFSPRFMRLQFLVKDITMFLLSVAAAMAIRFTWHNNDMRRRELEIDAERKQIELIGLKAQLNPHFLFNTLNNIYALIGIDTTRAQKAVHDLSSMLRFMIYDAESRTVPLAKELAFVSDYIELMKLRISPSLQLKVNISQAQVSDHQIAPLIFLTLIENAFKHGITGVETDFIEISINSDNEAVECRVRNSYLAGKSTTPHDHTHGVGLQNIRRQLSLLYPEKFVLDTSCHGDVFEVRLRIILSNNI